VATTLLTLGIALAGASRSFKLPVSPLPQVDFPTISVQAQLPGASPRRGDQRRDAARAPSRADRRRHRDDLAARSAQARITLQFGLDRDIDGAARDVQAAINAARADLPTSLRSNPTYRKVNPADAPILILALTSKTLTTAARSTTRRPRAAAEAVAGRAASARSSSAALAAGGARRAQSAGAVQIRHRLEDVRAALASANANSPKGAIDDGDQRYQIYTNDQATQRPRTTNPLVVAYRNGAAVRLSDVADVRIRSRTCATPASPTASRRCWSSCSASPAPTSSRRSTREGGDCRNCRRRSADIDITVAMDRTHDDPRLAARHRAHAGDRRRAGDPGGVPVPAQRRATLIPASRCRCR
jgi:multidrug efflux pump